MLATNEIVRIELELHLMRLQFLKLQKCYKSILNFFKETIPNVYILRHGMACNEAKPVRLMIMFSIST